MSLARSNARNSTLVVGVPPPHLVIGPRPFEWVGIQPVVLRPGVSHMLDEFPPAAPRSSLQVAVAKGVDQYLGLVQPRGMDRGESAMPPAMATVQVVLCRCGRVAGVAVVNQVDPTQVAMPPTELGQLIHVGSGVLGLDARCLHPSTMDDQERQDVDRAVSGVLELLLLDRAGDRVADRASLQNLAVRFLIGTDHPIAPLGQPIGVGIAPKNLLRPPFELGIDSGGPPVSCAVRLEVHPVEDHADRPVADGRDDTVFYRLAGQILARPMRDVQSLGDRLQARQPDNLSPLEGGKSGLVARFVAAGPAGWTGPSSRSGGRPSRWSRDRAVSE